MQLLFLVVVIAIMEIVTMRSLLAPSRVFVALKMNLICDNLPCICFFSNDLKTFIKNKVQ